MRISKLGEKKLIERLRKFLDVGDDCYALPYGGKNLILTSDMLYAPTHILDEMTWSQIGRHIVTVNFSDVAAMGAKPIAFLLDFQGPDMNEEDFLEMIKAADDMCKRYGASYVGGDLNEADELTLAGVAVGETDKPVYRKGAMVGDFVAVTGTVGDASLGVEVLVKHLTEEWDNQDFQNVLARTLDAEPRVKEGYFLRNYASAMTDISDSLAVSLNDIAREGEVGLSIDLAKIPLSDSGKNFAAQVKLNLLEFALYGGGDYELVFTVNPLDWKAVGKKVDAKVIGEVCKGHGITSTNGKNIPCNGFEHFRKK